MEVSNKELLAVKLRQLQFDKSVIDRRVKLLDVQIANNKRSINLWLGAKGPASKRNMSELIGIEEELALERNQLIDTLQDLGELIGLVLHVLDKGRE